MKMWMLRLFLVAIIAFLLFGQMDAKPYQPVSRQKRTSDQRLAELETLIALSKMNGKLVTIPIAFGKIDPNKIGRRRRSLSLLLQQLINDVSTEDKRSDELFQNVERKEEDGGEEKEEKVNRIDQTELLSEMLPQKTIHYIPARLLQ